MVTATILKKGWSLVRSMRGWSSNARRGAGSSGMILAPGMRWTLSFPLMPYPPFRCVGPASDHQPIRDRRPAVVGCMPAPDHRHRSGEPAPAAGAPGARQGGRTPGRPPPRPLRHCHPRSPPLRRRTGRRATPCQNPWSSGASFVREPRQVCANEKIYRERRMRAHARRSVAANPPARSRERGQHARLTGPE